MADTKSSARTVLIVLVAAVVIVCGTLITLVGASAFYISRHVQSDYVGTDDADARFTSARAKLASRSALLELRDGDDPIVHRPPQDGPPATIDAVHVMLYNPHDRKLMNVTLPAWLLRLGAGDHLQFIDDHEHFDSSRLHLTFADIERHGPGLIVDGTLEHGARLLIWTD